MPHKSRPMYMTESGFAKLEAQLEYLRNEKLAELAEVLHEASSGGDLVDNIEYLILREDFVSLNDLIHELENVLRNARLIERGEPDDRVHIGNTVVIQPNGGPPETYTIVGSVETDPDDSLISNESPMGIALLERAVGDEVTVNAPDGEISFRIIAVT